jgi:hypothetical protein
MDASDIRRVEECCSQAASFFHEEREGMEKGLGLRSIRHILGAQFVEIRHMQDAIDDVNAAIFRLRITQPDQFLPVAVKERHMMDLEQVVTILLRWRRALE